MSHAVDEGRTPAGLRDAYVKRYATQLLGQAADQLAKYTLHWKFSELSSVEIRVGPDDDGPALVRAILEAPTAELLTDITLVGVPDGSRRVDLSPAMDLLGGARRITTLGLVDDRARSSKMLVSRDFDADENLVTFGSIKPFVDRLVGLSFDVADSYAITDLENLSAPELRSFTLRNLHFCDYDDAQAMTGRLATAKCPSSNRSSSASPRPGSQMFQRRGMFTSRSTRPRITRAATNSRRESPTAWPGRAISRRS